jgi:uncharacterized protein involved in exopolysaccharide biosynthesis
VIDPPVAGFGPVAPARPRLILMVLAAGLAAGAGLAYLLHMMRPVFMNARMLADVTGLPVLGAVSETWASDGRYRHRRDLFAMAGAVAGLVVVFGFVFLWQSGGGRLPGIG